MAKTEPRTQDQALWAQADLLLNWALLVTCLMVIGMRARMVGLGILSMPVFWLVLLLLGLCIGEIRTLRQRGHRWAPASLMPLLMTLVSLIAVWQIHPGVHMWVLVSILLVFTRFAPGLALGIGAFSLSVSLAILILHWQADWRLLAPATMTGILELGILFIHFRASQRARAALDQTRELLTHTVDSMAQGLQVIAPDGQVLLHNQRLLELLELPPHLRATPVDFDAVHTYLRSREPERGETPEPLRLSGQASYETLQTPGGKTLEVRTQTLADQRQVRTYTDVSLYEQARLAALTHAQAKDRFLSNMSHELRTPLGNMLGLLRLMADTPLNPVQRDYLQQALQGAQSLLRNVNDVLDFSRIETGQLVPQPEPMDMQQFLAELASAAASHLDHKPIELRFELDDALPASVRADGQRLRQILLNLLSRALLTTEQGEVVLQIEVTQRSPGGVTLLFSVRDTGAGMTPQAQNQIFGTLTQFTSSRRQGGLGLELAICQRLLQLMGSSLVVDSAPGKGTRIAFELALPLSAQTATAPTQGSPHDPPRQVWVLDSNPQTAAHTLHLLSQAGCTARVVEPLHRIWAWLQQAAEQGNVPDAVLMNGADWKLADGKLAEHLARRWADTYPQLAAPLWLAMINHYDQFKPEAGALSQPIIRLLKPVLPSVLRRTLDGPRSRLAARSDNLAPAAPLPAGRLPQLQVLLAEDDPVNRDVCSQLLSQQGCIITLAHNGQEALDRLRQAPAQFDVVLMDLEMPVMDGLTAARLIREQLELQTLPIFALSASVTDADRMACLDAGMDQHLAKPFDLDKVIQALYPFVKRSGHTPR